MAYEEITKVNTFCYDLLTTGVLLACASTVSAGLPHADISKTNVQPESVGCSLSNTSCNGEAPDEIDSPAKNNTQVSATSLEVAINPFHSKSFMFEVRLVSHCNRQTISDLLGEIRSR